MNKILKLTQGSQIERITSIRTVTRLKASAIPAITLTVMDTPSEIVLSETIVTAMEHRRIEKIHHDKITV